MQKEILEIKGWTKRRAKLNNNYAFSDDWQQVIDLFKARMENKFFNPIQMLINSKLQEGEGFSILMIQCALIESFASFRSGQIYNLKKKGPYLPTSTTAAKEYLSSS